MRDIYTEMLVPVPSKPVYHVYKYVLIVLIVLSLVAAGMIGLPILLVTAVLVWLLLKVLEKSDSEYEYVHTNDCFDVDMVTHNSRRKSLVSVNLKQVALIAKADSADAVPYQNVPAKDYSGDCSKENLYAMVYAVAGSQKKLLLKLDENMLHSLKQWIPGKVK